MSPRALHCTKSNRALFKECDFINFPSKTNNPLKPYVIFKGYKRWDRRVREEGLDIPSTALL